MTRQNWDNGPVRYAPIVETCPQWGACDEFIEKMRGRIEQCRRLTRSTTDPRTWQVLSEMAAEGQADVRRLRAENT